MMSENPASLEMHSEPRIYEIRIKGHLCGQWFDWFDGLTITLEDDGVTLLAGPVVDEAALYGLLKRVRDLDMSLLSVHRIQPLTDKVNISDKKTGDEK